MKKATVRREKFDNCSNATFWRYANSDPNFPKPVNLNGGVNYYLESEFDKYLLNLAEKGKETADYKNIAPATSSK